MSTSRRQSTVCQVCCSRGKFTALEVLVHERECWHWRCLWLCAVCRAATQSLLCGAANAPGSQSLAPRGHP